MSEINNLSSLDASALDTTILDTTALSNSPLQKLHSPFLDKAEIQLYVKRDDLIHPLFGGNKWRKLKYNLKFARQQKFNTLLTFGGAWSNHIYATAAAARHYGFNSIGIIRGEKHTPLNATLTFAKHCGMQLHYVSRAEYRKKYQTDFQEKLRQQYGNAYILAEGGSNALAIKGSAEIVDEINNQINHAFDIICCACGTGATLAGLISALKPEQTGIGFSALKGGDFLSDEVKNFLHANDMAPEKADKSKTNISHPETNPENPNWHIDTAFHFGGYAKINDTLINFMRNFESQYGFSLDAVYTGKMFYGLFKRIEEKQFKPGTSIIALHSGGLQGNAGFSL